MHGTISSLLVVLIFATSVHAAPAARVPTGDPKAVALATLSLVALTKGASISDVTLTGDVTWNRTDSGPATFKALRVLRCPCAYTLLAERRHSDPKSKRAVWALRTGVDREQVETMLRMQENRWWSVKLQNLGSRNTFCDTPGAMQCVRPLRSVA